MNSRKSAGQRMEPWETTVLTGYSCKYFPSRTNWSSLVRKEKTRPNISPEIPWDLGLWRRPAWQILSKALDISSATARVTPNLLKIIAILSDATARRSTVDWGDLKPYWN